MANAFNRGILRSIRGSLGRFVAIACIVALGAGFYAGLRMTCPDMKLLADAYYDETALMDIRVVSTLGLTDDDVEALAALDGVEAAMGAFEVDILAEAGGEGYVMRVHSLPQENGPNQLVLTEGRLPEQAGECVISSDIVIGADVQVGDVIAIQEVAEGYEDVLQSTELVVVGKVSSSYYVTSSNMGTSTLGGGSIQDYLYVCEEEFSADTPYTEIFLTVAGAAALDSSGDAYDELVSEVEARVEELGVKRAAARTDEVVGDAQAQVDDAWAEYEDERAEAEAELDDAQAELDDAAAQIAEAQEEIESGEADYDEGVAALAASQAEADEQLAAAETELDEAQEAYDEAMATRVTLAAQLEEAQAGLSEAQAGIAAIDEGLAQLEAGLEEAQAGLSELAEGIAQVQAGIEAAYAAGLTDDDAAVAAYVAQLAELQAAQEEAAATAAGLEASIEDYAAQREELAATQAQLESAIEQLQAAIAQIDAQTEGVPAQIAAGRAELEEQRATVQAELAAAQAELDDAAARLDAAREELAEAQADYDEGAAELADARAEAEEQFAEAEDELADAQAQVDELEAAEWYVMDRDQNYGVASFEADANRIDSIAALFPFIFFLVAALVSLTTMTRMVEEERILIGTYKALGYSRGRIAWKYLCYALIASVIGCVVGIAVLSQVLPTVIMAAYSIIYFVPHSGLLPIDAGLTALSAGLSIGITLLATLAAVLATLRERPAALMLPRAPKAGKRILVERIRPLWTRLSFSWKVTCRNIFRYKKRFVMTVVGIAGCTALLLTGLGLSDAINDIIDKQFYDILRYNATITTEEDMSDEAAAELEALLSDGEYVTSSLAIGRATMSATSAALDDGDYEKAQIIAVSDTNRIGEFIDLRTRGDGTAVEISDDGAVLTEKLADKLGLSVGDAITLVEQDAIGNPTGASHTLVVTGIVENYIYDYVYTGASGWAELAGEDAVFESLLAVATTDADARTAFSEQARAIEGVKTVSFIDETIDTYRSMIASVNMIVVVLVVAAAALAFIVVYNLTNINITERLREIATLKVLGFTKGEVEAYIYRETILLSVLGAALGLVLGVYLETFVAVSAEVDQVMFGREIHPFSFVLAFVLTIAFTAFVMFVMRGKISSVSMVESLKSNE